MEELLELSSNRTWFWCVGQQRTTLETAGPPSTSEAAFILTGLKLPLGPGLQGEAAAPPPGVLLGGDGIIHPGSS